MPQEESVRICGNPACRLVYTPDPRIYKDPEDYCPRCGFEQSKSSEWKRRENG